MDFEECNKINKESKCKKCTNRKIISFKNKDGSIVNRVQIPKDWNKYVGPSAFLILDKKKKTITIKI